MNNQRLSGAQQIGIYDDRRCSGRPEVCAPHCRVIALKLPFQIEARNCKRTGHHLPNGMRFARSQDIIAIVVPGIGFPLASCYARTCLDLSQDSAHAVDVVGGKAPISTRLQIAHRQWRAASEVRGRNPGQPQHMLDNLARKKGCRPAVRFVVCQYAACDSQVVNFPVGAAEQVRRSLGARIRTLRIQRGGLLIKRCGSRGNTKHVGRGRLIEARLWTVGSNAFEQMDHCLSVGLPCV